MSHLAVLVLALHEDIFEEVVVVLLHLLVGDVGEVGAVSGLGRVLGVDVEVLQGAGSGGGGRQKRNLLPWPGKPIRHG